MAPQDRSLKAERGSRARFPDGILEDRDGDGVPDYLNAKIYVADDVSVSELAAAANIAARLAFEAISVDMPIGCRIGEFLDTDPTVAIVVGEAAGRWTGGAPGVVVATEGSRPVVAIRSAEDANRWAASICGGGYLDRDAQDAIDPQSPPGPHSLSNLYTDGLLSRAALSVGPDTRSPAVIDLAARIALETTGLALPLVVASDSDDRLAGPLQVCVGRTHPRVIEMTRSGELRLDLGSGDGRVEIVPDPDGGGSRLVIAGGGEAGETSALAWAAHRLPFASEYGKGNLELKDIEADLARFVSLGSPEGRLAAGIVRARARLATLAGGAPGSAGVRIDADGVPASLLARARDLIPTEFVTVRNAAFHECETIFEDAFTITWEVETARARFGERVLPLVGKGSEVDLEIRLSEPPDIRAKLAEDLALALVQSGADPDRTRVTVLSAHKQGYCWIDEILKSRLSGATSITIYVREAVSDSPVSIDPARRWLQELYPIDEILARDLGIRPDATSFGMTSAGPTYRVVARDASGSVLLEEAFEPAFEERPLFARFPDYATSRVATGWIRAKIDGRVRLDERVMTDPESFWEEFGSRGLGQLHDYLLDLYAGAPDPTLAPHFGTFGIEVGMSEPDSRIGIDEERISTLEALHEDIYFQTLLFIDLVGERYASSALPHPGRIIPWVRSEPGAAPSVRIRLTGKRSPGPSVRIDGWREELRPLPPARSRVRNATLRAGSSGAELGVGLDGVSSEAASMLTVLAEFRHFDYPGIAHIEARLPDTRVRLPTDGSVEERPRLAAIRPLRHPIIAPGAPLNSTEAGERMAELAWYPQVRPFFAGRSFLGKPIWALDVTSPIAGRYVSQARLSVTKPVLFITGRQHGNEISGTTHILRLVESLVSGDEATRRLLDRVSLVVQPVTNPDGADLADELSRTTPEFMLHAGYYGCLGVDVACDPWNPDALYPESRVRRDLWKMWQPDVVLDAHGYPSHEWVQLFGGYSAWFRSRESIRRDWWIPRGAFVPLFGAIDDPRYPDHPAAASTIREEIARALDRTMGEPNRRMLRRYAKYVPPQEDAPPPALRTFARRRPDVTVFEGIIELPDETARGPWLETLTGAGLEASLAVLRFLARSRHRVRRTRRVENDRIHLRISRARPVLPARIRAVLFDAVGTLFRSRGTIGEIYSERASRHGVPASPERLERRFQELTRSAGAPLDKAGWRSLVANVFEDVSAFDDFDAFFEEVYGVFRSASGWRLFAETESVLDRLRKSGLRLGVVTNFDNRVVRVLEDLGIARFFDAIQTPEYTGFHKPDPRIFELAAASLGSTPAQTVVVGDDPVQDLDGARRAGMHGLLLDRRPGPDAAAFLIRDLEGVLVYLRSFDTE